MTANPMTATPPARPQTRYYWVSYNPRSDRWQVLGAAYTRDGEARSLSVGAYPVDLVRNEDVAYVNRTGKLPAQETDNG